MIFSTTIADHSTPGRAFAIERPAQGLKLNQVIPERNGCRAQIDRVILEIESLEVREIMSTIFGDLLGLLDFLSSIKSHLRQVESAEETFALFQIIHDEARALVKFIRDAALPCEAINQELADTLDGITFAVNHDLQRVFKTSELVNIEEGNAQVVVAKVIRDHDMLTNCLQQATISLAIMFDPELVGTKLFNNSDMRYRQSIQLCEHLSTLLNLVEACGETKEESAFAGLTAGIEKFRNESMEFLMYSDLPQFESFCERILAATPADMEPVLHQFCCYVETLLGQVRMRAVLADVIPVQFGTNDTIQWPSADAKRSTSLDLQDEDAAWNTLALAI